MFFLSFNVKNGDLDVRWQLRHKQLKELEMDHLVFSRRKVLGQMAVSAAGILSLSATNKVFAGGNSIFPYMMTRVNYRAPDRKLYRAVGAWVTITCTARNLSFSQATDINGQVRFNLHEYYGHHRPRGNYPSDTWIITATFRGRRKQTTISVHPNFSTSGTTIEFDLR